MLHKLKRHPSSSHGSGLIGNVVTTAEYAGASYLAGYLANAFPGKAHIRGVPIELAGGVAAKVVSLGLTLLGAGGGVRPHLDVFGNAFIGAYFHTLGSGHGGMKSGRTLASLPASSASKLKAAVPEATILGIASRAPKGDLLTAQDIADMAGRVR